jgi:hypothetical protein
MDEIRAHARRELDALPAACRRIDSPEPLRAGLSPGLLALAEHVDREFP